MVTAKQMNKRRMYLLVMVIPEFEHELNHSKNNVYLVSNYNSPMNYPKKVTIGDITVRDGFQHEEKFIPTAAKLWLTEQLILAGFRHVEVTNLGNPSGMPQFKDSDELLKKIRASKTVAHLLPNVSLTAVTIREKAI